MKLISDYYKHQNQKLHEENPKYGKRGNRHLPTLYKLMREYKCKEILDYGCGKGFLSKSSKYPVQNYDPAIPEYDIDPVPSDMVVCTDVLEHIEPELLDNVLTHIHSLTIKCAYFVIATRPDNSKTLPDGSNPHRIVNNADWWVSKLNQYCKTVSVKPRPHEVQIVCIPS